MLELLTRASALAKQVALPGFLTRGESLDRPDLRFALEFDAEGMDGPCQIISSRRQVVKVLQQLIDARSPIALAARSVVGTSVIRVLSIDIASGCLRLRQVTDDVSHARVMLDGRVNITARHNNAPLFFTLDLLGSGHYGRIPCYIAAIPDWMFLAQMRESFRVCLPQSLDAGLVFDVPRIGTLRARVLDISESGVGALLPGSMAGAVAANQTFPDATLDTRDGSLSPIGFTLRYVEGALGGAQRLGAVLNLSTESLRQNLRRLVLRHQPLRTSLE
jgi:c-di-GMP-binding flagellar brake protein YcgR